MDLWKQVFLFSLFIDIFFGEPIEILHPVVYMGKFIGYLSRHAPLNHRKLYGFFMSLICVGISIIIGVLASKMGIIISAFLLSTTFSINMLLTSALNIEKKLKNGEIEKVRKSLKTFVGRDTSELDAHKSASCVIESVSENFVDGILSPLFYFFLFGIPGAFAYRTINTLDSMIGYKNQKYLELGYFAAKLDDIANFIPSRLSVLFIFIGSIFIGKTIDSLKTCLLDHNKTESPNSGFPISAISGACNVKLEKIGHYIIGENYPEPEPDNIRDSVYIIGFSSFFMAYFLFFSL